MTSPSSLLPEESSVAIVGVGLIGGSIAAALKARNFGGRVIGVGRNRARLEAARERLQLDAVLTNLSEAAAQASLLVFCTPVDRIVAGVVEAAHAAASGTLITDAGSTKREICASLRGRLPEGVTFIGSHPLAGGEKSGFEYADPELYRNRVCVLTPDATAPAGELKRLEQFWQALGMRLVQMTPEEHDAALATTSHLPHVVAAALALCLEDHQRPLAATGFRDTTRIAAGDEDLWTAILGSNAENVLAAIDRCTAHLAEFRTALEQKDAAALQALLAEARDRRVRLEQR